MLDYTQSQVDYETVQVAPVSGGSSFTNSSSVGNAARVLDGRGGGGGRTTAEP